MKDGLGAAAILRLAESLEKTVPGFSKKTFIPAALDGLEALELKERVRHITRVLHRTLPGNFNETADLLVQLKPNWISGDPDDNLESFAAWPILDYIGEYGRSHPEKALDVLKELTGLFSAEFALRPFLTEHTELTLQTVERWCADPDEHVRRLVSEGTRPRLPWGHQLPQFIKDPAPGFRLLEKLKDDPSAYVRRSVANHLNDISKDHPDAVIALCRRWKKDARADRKSLIRLATRTLVKTGHPDVFGLLGYTPQPKLDVQSLKVSPKNIRMGESITFKLTLQSTHTQPQTVVIDYAIHHMKANGKTTPKVFKLKALTLAAGETVELTHRHSFRPITTRKYYPGRHSLEILVNGKPGKQTDFMLRSSEPPE